MGTRFIKKYIEEMSTCNADNASKIVTLAILSVALIFTLGDFAPSVRKISGIVSLLIVFFLGLVKK